MNHNAPTRTLHFDLRWLGPEHATTDYVVRVPGAQIPLTQHNQDSLAELQPVGSPTHYALEVAHDPAKVQLVRVTGAPTAEGIPTLQALAISTTGDSGSYDAKDTAKAIVFLNPTVSVLTPEHAETVLGHIDKASWAGVLPQVLDSLGASWVTARVLDDAATPKRKDGLPHYVYDLHPEVLTIGHKACSQAKVGIYSDPTLEGVRWNQQAGISTLEVPNAAVANAAVATPAVVQRRTSVPGAAQPDALVALPEEIQETVRRHQAVTDDLVTPGVRNLDGYKIDLSDGGPDFGVSARVNSLSDNFVIDLKLSNNFIRHLGVYVSFLDSAGKAMTIQDEDWLKILKGAARSVVQEFLDLAGQSDNKDLKSLLGDKDETLKFLGYMGAEATFLGVPVHASSSSFQFGLPTGQGPVGKIRLLTGSMGIDSHNDWDPEAAWFGLALTAFVDLAIPTFSLVLSAGEESNSLFDKIFKDKLFLLQIAWSVFLIAKDLFTSSSNLGGHLKSALLFLANALVTKVLTSAEVVGKLAAVFGSEEVEEAVPVVGWGLKLLAMEASVEQLAQTIGEVIASPRVVEFDLTVTMDAEITLKPGDSGEFPATATAYTLTAQYSGNTARTTRGTIDNPKVPEIKVRWNDVPVGGEVTFVVAFFSEEGWGVGKGHSAQVPNHINGTDAAGNKVFATEITVTQKLYPLSVKTTYQHDQILGYGTPDGYHWRKTSEAPKETRSSLGTGPRDKVVEQLAGITVGDDLGVLGYSWQASGLGIPAVHGDDDQTELYTLQNLGFKPLADDPSWPQAGYMTAPQGFSQAPLLLYLRQGTVQKDGPPRFLWLDPTGDRETGYHLRQVQPVTDPKVPFDSPKRQFPVEETTSWGRFSPLPSSLAMHANGTVVAVNPEVHTVQVLRLSKEAKPDAQAHWAYSPTGPGTAPARVDGPALAAIRPDQTILILEQGNRRVQAFSSGGHPVQAFAKKAFWFPLVERGGDANTVYLSMSVDVANNTFVLSQLGNGYHADQFYLDVYEPSGELLFSQQGLVAGGLAVDLWRNVYTLNFEQLSGPGGRPEPTLSEYIPSTPKS